MSSSNEASVQGVRFISEGREGAGVSPPDPRAPWGVQVGLEFGPPQGQDLDLEYEEGGEVGWTMLPGCEGRPSSPAEEKDAALGFLPLLSVDSAAIVQKLTSLQALNTCRLWSPESLSGEPSAIWAKAGPSVGGTLASSLVEGQQASATSLLHPSGPQGDLAWGNMKKDTTTRMMVSGDAQQPFSDLVSSAEFNEIQLMKLFPKPVFQKLLTFLAPPQMNPVGSALPSGMELSDQEPPVYSPIPERQQQAPRAWSYPQCVALQKKTNDINKQLEALQALNEKFQNLGS